MFVGHPRPVTARDVLEAIRSGRRAVAAVVIRVPHDDHPPGRWGLRRRRVRIRRAAATQSLAVWSSWRLRDLSVASIGCATHLGVVAALDLREGVAQTAAWYRREGWI